MPAPPTESETSGPRSVSGLVREHFDFVWRSLRRFGLSPSDADDAAQEVFIVLGQKLEAVVVGQERGFLYGTARRVAARARRGVGRRREADAGNLDGFLTQAPGPDEILQQRQACDLVNQVLASFPVELSDVFALHEIEQLTMAEISSTVGIAPGTVASRLRRARVLFQDSMRQLEEQLVTPPNPHTESGYLEAGHG